MKLVNFVIFSSILIINVHLSVSTSCREVVSRFKIHPIDCCVYPRIFDDEEVTEKCKKQCENHEKPCCDRGCYLKEIGVYKDGDIDQDAILNMFIGGKNLTDVTEEDKVTDKSSRPIDDKWKEIIQDSTKTCLEEHKPEDGKVAEDKICHHTHDLFICIRKQNFINCPDYSQSNVCIDIMNLVKTCDKHTQYYLYGAFVEGRKWWSKDSMSMGMHG